MVLFINACVRKESRTLELAKYYLAKLNKEYEEIKLNDINFPIVDNDFINKRDKLIDNKEYNDPLFDLANKFKEATDIVIAAPYWDLSFPASLKQFFEQINVVGITFYYNYDGLPCGLCEAKSLTYITTSGGIYVPFDYGYKYVEALCKSFYGINDIKLIKALGLDIDPKKVDKIIENAKKEIDKMF